MSEVNFNSKAFTYADNALVQKSASEVLLNLLSIQPEEDILDIGCGPGHITKKIAQITKGTVLGIDVSQGMIEQAVSSNKELPNLKYSVMDAESFELNTKLMLLCVTRVFSGFKNQNKY